MSIQILVQRLRVSEIANERIEAIEGATRWIIYAGTQVLLAALHRPLAAVEDARQRGGGGGQAGASEHVAVGVVGVLLSDGAECIQKRPRAAVAVGDESEDFLYRSKTFWISTPRG